ncbi:hypothetical protein TNCV_3536571 [Trichonephila clavipes]|uniref:Uncharacterized protein n=1 Tax=Trichonephila clavipes TaxID=2585209 RepID=A0A8X6VWP8_TRICX|nr:hypothetical protein TNCV_3536571 [Trichonephila clavipes]
MGGLKWIVRVISKKQTTAAKVSSVSIWILQCQLIEVRRPSHNQNIYARAAIPKPLVTDVTAKRRLQRCSFHKTWWI